jgi:hypothetical protein
VPLDPGRYMVCVGATNVGAGYDGTVDCALVRRG